MRSKKNPIAEVAGTVGKLKDEKVQSQETNVIPELDRIECITELMTGMTVEEMTAMFFDGALIEPPYKIWQLNSNGKRYYYRYDDNGNPEFYPSVTTILSQTLPKSPFLINWIANKGIEESERYKAERAAYGSFMHAAFEELIINRTYNLNELKQKLRDYIDANSLPDDFIYYADELKKDVLAFAQFVIDYDVKPIAVEIALIHPEYKYAGMIDLPCSMRETPCSDNRINAIIDFKSGRKGFHEENEIQLHMYKDMWNANFPDIPICKVMNFSPKEWRKKPTYNLKDQTNSPNANKIPYLLALAEIEDDKKESVFTSVSGIISLDDNQDLSNNIVSMTLSEIVKGKKKQPEKPQEEQTEADETKNKPENATKTRSNGTKSKRRVNTRKKKDNASESKNEEN